ncbi:HD domain-containing phosphohydrolase [Anoxynatronum sibiricum]|uniref:HD domain-containing phosphohydrolase n=1 Tax=Anoxynatronum sibiricum TaxID=210623 RepID=A0ABU9VVM0_9CLOT
MLEWLVFRPESILTFGQLLLSLVITTVLWKRRKQSVTSKMLALFFVANTLATLFTWLADVNMIFPLFYYLDALTLIFYLVGTFTLVMFTYHFSGVAHQQKREIKYTQRFFALLVTVGIGGGIAYCYSHQHLFLMLLLGMNILGYSGVVLVMLKQAVVHQDDQRRVHSKKHYRHGILELPRKIQQALFSPSDRVEKGLRGFLGTVCLYFFLSMMAAVYWMSLYQIIPIHYFLLVRNAGLILFQVLFLQAYLAYSPEPTTFMTKLSVGTLAMVIFVVASIGFIHMSWVENELKEEWLSEVKVIEQILMVEENADLQHFQTSSALAFVVFQPEEKVQLPVKTTFSLLDQNKTARILFQRDETLSLNNLYQDSFFQGNYSKGFAYTGGRPEQAYVVYQLEDGNQRIKVGYLALQQQDNFNEPAFLVMQFMVLGMIMVLLLFPRFFRNSVVLPVMTLLEGVQKVEEGDLQVEVPISSFDEIGRLTDTFNRMTHSLKEADDFQKHHHHILQKQVDERTFELKEALAESRQLQQSLRHERELLKTTVFSMGDALIATDGEGNITIMNDLAERMTGWSQAVAHGKPFDEVFRMIDEQSGTAHESPVEQVLKKKAAYTLPPDTLLVARDGRTIPIEDSVAPIKDEGGHVTGVVVVFRDFTEKKEKQDKILHLSYHDQLTGVYNRHFFETELKRLDAHRNLPLSLLILDLNGLKLINDAFGHQVGDQAVQRVAAVMQQACRNDELIARIGGDEFVIILPNTRKEDAEKLAMRIQQRISEVPLKELQISASVGWATKEEEPESIAAIFKEAEDKMYRRKLMVSQQVHLDTINMVLNTFYENHQQEKNHAWQVARLCEAMGSALGLESESVERLQKTGYMHDIGKGALPQELLKKTADLTPDERRVVERHPELGYQMLRSSQEYAAIAENVLGHHEHWDGSGYPRGIVGEKIPLEARIVALAEAWDSMTTHRPYRKARTPEAALKEIKALSGIRFDPELVPVFESVLMKENLI